MLWSNLSSCYSLHFFSVTADTCFVKPSIYSKGLEEYESYFQIFKDSKENLNFYHERLEGRIRDNGLRVEGGRIWVKKEDFFFFG